MRNLWLGTSLLIAAGVIAACGADSTPGDDASTPDGGSPPSDGGQGTETFSLSGTVAGLRGAGLILQNNDGDDLVIAKDGSFTFSTKLAAGAAFNVKIKTQPSTPAQTCSVSGGTGTIVSGDATGVVVNCATDKFTVGGNVSGVLGSGLVLQLNGGETVAVSASGAFVFPTAIDSGASYTVTVSAQPTAPAQTCVVGGGTGTVGAANVTSVSVNCTTNKYLIGGTSTGVAGTGLVLQNNGGDDLTVTASGTFAFATPLESGAAYAVTIASQPTAPSQTCTLANDSGTVDSANVSNITLTCTTNAYKVSGTVTGLAGSGLVLQNNGGDDIPMSADGNFSFTTSVLSGQTYTVTVATQPSNPSQTCVVTGGTGTMTNADVATVSIACTTNKYAIGGTVSGASGPVVLTDNGGDDLTVNANGTFTFATKIASGAAYSVAVKTPPAGQGCALTNESGTVGSADVTNITIACGGPICRPNGAGDVYCYLPGDSIQTRAFKACEAHFGGGNCCVITGGYNSQQYGKCGSTGYDPLPHFHWDNHPNGHCAPNYVAGDVVSKGWCGEDIGSFLTGRFSTTEIQMSGLTLKQTVRCESVADDGMTCINPIVKYGTVDFGVPSAHPANDYVTWCQSLGFNGFASVTYGNRSYDAPAGKLFGCSGYDEGAWHWCDWQDGYWYNQSLAYHAALDGKAITSITCN